MIEPTAEQIHRVCGYLLTSQDRTCKRCPLTNKSPYGTEIPGCVGTAEETIRVVQEVMQTATDRKPTSLAVTIIFLLIGLAVLIVTTWLMFGVPPHGFEP